MVIYRSAILALFLAVLWIPPGALAQNIWEHGRVVGLRADTCIREGPGLHYHAHTRVPENEWAVMVIGGPRAADGYTWWDTSRRAAGDPSGGTGWVAQAQNDTNCASSAVQSEHYLTRQDTPPSVYPSPTGYQDTRGQLQDWWFRQPALIKWGIAILVLLLVPVLWRHFGGVFIGLIGAFLLAISVWLILDLTRSLWQSVWFTLASGIFGNDVPDLALLLAMLPLASWGLSLIARRVLGKSTT